MEKAHKTENNLLVALGINSEKHSVRNKGHLSKHRETKLQLSFLSHVEGTESQKSISY